MTIIEQILYSQGPMMSGQLSRLVAERESIPENSASQKVRRTKDILKIKGFFTSQQSFCYLEEHKNTVDLFECLSKAMFEHGRKYWYCLNALKLNNGIIPKQELECYTNYPIEKLKGHRPFSDVMSIFINEKIIIYDDECYYLSLAFANISYNSIKSRVISQIKQTVLNDFSKIVKNTGFVSYNTVEFFAEYGKFRWGIKGVSYISGLRNGDKSGYLLADIILGNAFYSNDVEFFVKKIDHVLSFARAPRLIPFLIVDNIDEDALKLLKSKGVVVGFIGELFGQKYSNALIELVGMLNNIGASMQQTPEKFINLISELEIYNKTLVNNIKGSLFEFFVGHIVQRKYPNIDPGRIIYGEKGKCEIDIFAYNSDSVIIIECKATKSAIGEDEIRKWQREVIPLVQAYIKTQHILVEKNIIFEYWSISGFTNEAKLRLEQFKKNATVFTVDYYDTEGIKTHVDNLKNKTLSTTLQNYFIKSNL